MGLQRAVSEPTEAAGLTVRLRAAGESRGIRRRVAAARPGCAGSFSSGRVGWGGVGWRTRLGQAWVAVARVSLGFYYCHVGGSAQVKPTARRSPFCRQAGVFLGHSHQPSLLFFLDTRARVHTHTHVHTRAASTHTHTHTSTCLLQQVRYLRPLQQS